MASFDYAKSAATAKRLLTRFGQPLTFILPDRVEDGPPGVPGTTTPGRSITGVGVKLDYRNNEIDGELIQSGDVRVLLEATAEPPEIGMLSALGSYGWRVMDWSPLEPAATTVMYTLQLRRTNEAIPLGATVLTDSNGVVMTDLSGNVLTEA